MTAYEIPCRTVSEANAHEHWRARQKRTKALRTLACLCTGPHVGQQPQTVTLTRVSPGQLDSDNLAASLKAVRDGIADAFGMKDGPDGVVWLYRQRRGKPATVEVQLD